MPTLRLVRSNPPQFPTAALAEHYASSVPPAPSVPPCWAVEVVLAEREEEALGRAGTEKAQPGAVRPGWEGAAVMEPSEEKKSSPRRGVTAIPSRSLLAVGVPAPCRGMAWGSGRRFGLPSGGGERLRTLRRLRGRRRCGRATRGDGEGQRAGEEAGRGWSNGITE